MHTGEQLEQQHKVQYSCWHPSWSLTRLDGIPSPYRALDVGCRVAGVRELCAPQPVCLSAELCGQSMELFQKKGTHKYELTLHQNFLNCVVPGAGKTGSGIKLMKSTCLELGCTWPQGSHGSRCKKSLCKCWRHLGKHSYTRHCIDISWASAFELHRQIKQFLSHCICASAGKYPLDCYWKQGSSSRSLLLPKDRSRMFSRAKALWHCSNV